MGIKDKLKNIVNPRDIDEGYEDDEYVFDDGGNGGEYATNYDSIYDRSAQTGYTQRASAGTSYSGGGMELNGTALELKVIKPKTWDSVNQIADHLISKRTVVLNLEDTSKEDARRMIDFLLGVIYTIEGDIKKVTGNTWVLTPNNVDLSQDGQRAAKESANDGMSYTSM